MAKGMSDLLFTNFWSLGKQVSWIVATNIIKILTISRMNKSILSAVSRQTLTKPAWNNMIAFD